MNPKSSVWYSAIVLLAVLTLLIGLFVLEVDPLEDLILFIVAVVSMLIALFAYHISIKTYVSIDVVNAISRMDGNVMENEGYRTNILALLRRFDAEEKGDAGRSLIGAVQRLFAQTENVSGARLADRVQEVIDMIILLPFIVKSNDDDYANYCRREIDSVLLKISESVDTFETMSEGSCILMKESVKLIEAVFGYQKMSSLDETCASTLMDVRGTMLRNAVSRTVFYNYMGLLYLSKASLAILAVLKRGNDKIALYRIETLRACRRMAASDYPETVYLYLENAIRNFGKALSVIGDDVMWNAFIQFNIARAEFLMWIVSAGREGLAWNESMNRAVRCRAELNLILDDMLPCARRSYFHRAFIAEERKAKLLKLVFEIVAEQDITNSVGQVLCPAGAYESLLSHPLIAEKVYDEFGLFDDYQENILNYVGRSVSAIA